MPHTHIYTHVCGTVSTDHIYFKIVSYCWELGLPNGIIVIHIFVEVSVDRDEALPLYSLSLSLSLSPSLSLSYTHTHTYDAGVIDHIFLRSYSTEFLSLYRNINIEISEIPREKRRGSDFQFDNINFESI